MATELCRDRYTQGPALEKVVRLVISVPALVDVVLIHLDITTR